MKKICIVLCIAGQLLSVAYGQSAADTIPPRVQTANGIVEGLNESGIRSFKGIPFAQPPVGNLRWKEPLPVKNWEGVRKADKFGARAMQLPLFGDMNFRSNGMSEDCLYLNIWTPAQSNTERLPVLVYFYGGGFVAGDGSEPRYEGPSLARRGMVTITVNYRLSIFGFFAHPELTQESPHHASGNYGLMDQSAALHWVQQNIAAFGGDPKKITIGGESAGSFAVSALMASPLSRNIIAGAIGESGSLLGAHSTVTLSEGEQSGIKFASSISASTLAALRSMPAEEILKATSKPGYGRFPVTVDGYFFPKSPVGIYAAGEQAHVPLLAGWNSMEGSASSITGAELTVASFTSAVQKLYGDQAPEILKVYQVSTDQDVQQVATDLASDRFIGFSTWKWSDLHGKTGKSPVYRYLYERPRPVMRQEMGNVTAGLAGGIIKTTDSTVKKPPAAIGAVHSAEIEYALGNLPTNRVFDWQPQDFWVSEIMETFFANFIKTGNPNGTGVPAWPAVKPNAPALVMHINVHTRVETEKNRPRYLLLDGLPVK
ncbi:MAG: carboxylesterase family protein [Chitinophagaceae bacterium]